MERKRYADNLRATEDFGVTTADAASFGFFLAEFYTGSRQTRCTRPPVVWRNRVKDLVTAQGGGWPGRAALDVFFLVFFLLCGGGGGDATASFLWPEPSLAFATDTAGPGFFYSEQWGPGCKGISSLDEISLFSVRGSVQWKRFSVAAGSWHRQRLWRGSQVPPFPGTGLGRVDVAFRIHQGESYSHVWKTMWRGSRVHPS